MFNWMKALCAVGVVALLSACGGSDDEPPSNLVQTLQADPQYSILVEAVGAAELTETLSGNGPFTLLAPTNAAFASLLTELGTTKDELLANKTLLSAVLTYHVVPASVPKASVPLGKAIATVQGGIFKIDSVGADLVVTDGRNRTGKVIATDLVAGNGVIHTVDKVILPADKTLVEIAQGIPDFSILVDAVVAADLVEALSAAGPLTVFAPTNAAFAALLDELGVSKEALLANKPLLTAVLTYHVLDGRVLKADVPVGAPITTLQGDTFAVDATLTITDQRGRTAGIGATDVLASNGVIHVIDKVILPAE
jgi:uncharacterized surface protein with fasciclin (FAS1) repeats